MKRLLIGVLGLLCAQMACAECVEVTPDPYKTLTPLASSGTVQITVTLDGKPLPNAKVMVSTKGDFLLSVSGDAHGVAQLRDLKPGRYLITTSENEASDEILLDVSAKPPTGVSLFTMNLVNTFALPYFGGRFPAKLAEMPASEDFREFAGVVRDQSGASVAGAEIEIYPSGTWERATLVHVIADQDGHFSAKLPDGLYRAVIHMPGFKPYPVVFRILQAGDTKEFLAVLQIGSC
jgi:hypothetical protein